MAAKVQWGRKQFVANKIAKHLQGKSEEEIKELMLLLLEHVDPAFVEALEFSYEIVNGKEK